MRLAFSTTTGQDSNVVAFMQEQPHDDGCSRLTPGEQVCEQSLRSAHFMRHGIASAKSQSRWVVLPN